MNKKESNLLLNWLISTLAIGISAYILTGVTIDSFLAAFATALILGIINAFIRPLLILFTLPLTILTLGLFTFVINAILVILTSWIVPGFTVANFWWALLFSLLVSLINAALYNFSKPGPKDL